MGNREDLLAGAKRSLLERGYMRTTARDIAEASGVSLAAIGYHFGSKESLLNQAVFELVGEIAEREPLPSAAEVGVRGRFEAFWDSALRMFAQNRTFWAANMEVVSQAEHVPEIREYFAGVQDMVHEMFAQDVAGLDAGDPAAPGVGKILHALMIGVMVKWFLDPAKAPTGAELADAIRTIAASFGPSAEDG
jgi:AcrR family transcriptional regulator